MAFSHPPTGNTTPFLWGSPSHTRYTLGRTWACSEQASLGSVSLRHPLNVSYECSRLRVCLLQCARAGTETQGRNVIQWHWEETSAQQRPASNSDSEPLLAQPLTPTPLFLFNICFSQWEPQIKPNSCQCQPGRTGWFFIIIMMRHQLEMFSVGEVELLLSSVFRCCQQTFGACSCLKPHSDLMFSQISFLHFFFFSRPVSSDLVVWVAQSINLAPKVSVHSCFPLPLLLLRCPGIQTPFPCLVHGLRNLLK